GESGFSQPLPRARGVGVTQVTGGDAEETARAAAALVRPRKGGLSGRGGARASFHRDLIITLAARHKLPAVYFERSFAFAGGLVSYGPDFVDQFRRAAGYVDRITGTHRRCPLRGNRPEYARRELPHSSPWRDLEASMAPRRRHRAASPSATARSNGAQDWKSTRH